MFIDKIHEQIERVQIENVMHQTRNDIPINID